MRQRIILGMGAGQCGLNLLAEILAKQPSSQVSLEQAPLLPWEPRPDRPGIAERLQRWRSLTGTYVGDVAAFYLPYVEAAIEAEPEIRMICLKRPRDEVVAGFCRQLDQNRRLSLNHWAQTPAPGASHDPLWTPTFPQYDTEDRAEGLRRYWEEYYGRAAALERRFPDHLRVVDTDALTTPEGVRATLDFAGIAREEQVIVMGQRPRQPATLSDSAWSPAGRFRHPMDPGRCAILVPFNGFIHQECDAALKELERRGYHVRRVGGFAAIDQGRNQIATDVLIEGFEETLWVDADVVFHPDDVERLRGHGLPITCGIYPQKGKLALACHMMPGTPRATFGKQGGLVELLYAGAGFLHIRREVYLTIQATLKLPVCNERFKHPMIPFFHPMVRPIDDGHWYLAEDYAFCERARQCGFKVLADTSIRLWHIGTYRYGWEDSGMERPRFGSFTLNFREYAREQARDGSPADRPFESAFADFAAAYPWPDARPEAPAASETTPPHPATRRALEETVPREARLLVEVGAGPGRSTRSLADLAPRARVIAVDPWREPGGGTQPEGSAPTPGPRPLEAFLSESWDYRERIVPVRAGAGEGLRRIADAGLQPDLVSLNIDLGAEEVPETVAAALDLFPHAAVVGNDAGRPEARQAVERLAHSRRLRMETLETSWRIVR